MTFTDDRIAQGLMLPVMETFYSLQGEGYHTGKAAFFVRIGGCDNGCWWCDIKESWDAELHPAIHIDEVVFQAEKHPARSVVITGGEPLLYNLNPLCALLHQKGFEIFLETSGSEPPRGSFDWICLSPKKQSPPLDALYPVANELKVIIFEQSDIAWAEDNAYKVNPGCKLFMQAEWSAREVVTPAIVDYILQHPWWMLSLQSHKYIHIP